MLVVVVGPSLLRLLNCAPPSEVVGIDPSDAQIKFAQNRPVAKPVNFQTGDGMALPFEADTLIQQRWP